MVIPTEDQGYWLRSRGLNMCFTNTSFLFSLWMVVLEPWIGLMYANILNLMPVVKMPKIISLNICKNINFDLMFMMFLLIHFSWEGSWEIRQTSSSPWETGSSVTSNLDLWCKLLDPAVHEPHRPAADPAWPPSPSVVSLRDFWGCRTKDPNLPAEGKTTQA